MMNILIDLVTPQAFLGGAGEYIRRVFYELLKRKDSNIQFFAAIDSTIGKFAYSDFTPDSLRQKGIPIVDLGKIKLFDAIKKYNIEKVFIGAAQYWGARYEVEKLTCRVICVVHDLQDEECGFNKIHLFNRLRISSRFSFIKYLIKDEPKMNWMKRMNSIIKLYNENKNVVLVTVSEYTKSSLEYYYGIKDRIYVLYSPARVAEHDVDIENSLLKKITEEKQDYFLLLSANRPLKNAQRVLEAFEKYYKCNESPKCLLTVGLEKPLFAGHYALPYLSASDLINAYKNSYALLFPSMFEGFGYPPIEAMQYGKPVLASNVTSIPEVCGEAAIYFSPFYVSDIFRALLQLKDSNYQEYCKKSIERYEKVKIKQQSDLTQLLNFILKK